MTISLALVACGQAAPADRDERASSKSDASTRVVDAVALDASADAALLDADAGYIQLPENTSDEPKCIKLVVGPAREAATLCDATIVSYWMYTRQVVRVVRAGKSVPVLDVMTKIVGSDNFVKMLDVQLRIAADGMSATTVDSVEVPYPGNGRQPGPTDDCDERYHHEDGVEVPSYRDLRRRVCKGRGDYRWNGDRFVHVP